MVSPRNSIGSSTCIPARCPTCNARAGAGDTARDCRAGLPRWSVLSARRNTGAWSMDERGDAGVYVSYDARALAEIEADLREVEVSLQVAKAAFRAYVFGVLAGLACG